MQATTRKATMNQTTESQRPKWLLPAAVGAIAGLVIGAGGAYALGGSDAGPDTDATLTLPEELDDLRVTSVVIAETTDNESALEAAATRDQILEEVTATLSAAHDGAATTSRSYADDELDTRVTVFAVAAPLPGLWSSQDVEGTAELLGTATPNEWVEAEGDAQCLVFPKVQMRAGTDPDEVEPLVKQCQVVRDGVTVILQPNGQLAVDRGLELVTRAADELVVD